MPTEALPLVSFAAGEWARALWQRIDFEKYRQSCRYTRNGIPSSEGPITKRPGSRYVDATLEAGEASLIPWVRSRTLAFMLEMGDQYYGVLDESGRITMDAENEFDKYVDNWVVDTSGGGSASYDEIEPFTWEFIFDRTGGAADVTYRITGLATTTSYTITYDIQIVDDTGGAYDFAGDTNIPASTPTGWVTFSNNVATDGSGNLDIVAQSLGSGGNTQYRIRNIRVQIAAGAPDYQSSPYSATDASAYLQWAQSFDVMYLVDGQIAPRTVSRFDANDWRMEQLDISAMPLLPENTDQASLITASATTGLVTLTAETATFVTGPTGHTGAQFAFRSVIEGEYDPWKTGTAYTAGDLVYGNSYETPGVVNVYRATNNASSGDREPGHNSGTESDGAVSWAFVHSKYTYVRIVSVASTTSATAAVYGELPAVATSGMFRWSESAWSNYRGWPRCVCFFENRLVFAHTPTQPYTFWGSAVDDYTNFSPGISLATDAFNYTINDARNAISFLSPSRVLTIATEGAIFVASGGGDNDAVTPTNIKVSYESAYGADQQQPARADNYTVYVQRGGNNMRDFRNSAIREAQDGFELSHISRDMAALGLNRVYYQETPEQRLWTYGNDGTLISVLYNRQLENIAWNRHDVGGDVISAAIMPTADGNGDRLWLVVKRTVNGGTVYYVEVVDGDDADTYEVFQDSYVRTVLSPASDTVTGLDHLEGEEVSVVVDGATHPNRTVTSGQITLGDDASIVSVGIYTSMIVDTQDVEGGGGNGPSRTKKKRIHRVGLGLIETGPGLKIGVPGKTLDAVPFRVPEDLQDTAVPLYTGDRFIQFPGGWSTDEIPGGLIRIEHSEPLPCTLTALYPQITTND